MTSTEAARTTFPEDGRRRVRITKRTPCIEGGRYAAKRVIGDVLTVVAELVADGHDVVRGVLRVKRPGATEWVEQSMVDRGNDRFEAQIDLDAIGRWELSIDAWVAGLETWQHGIERKAAVNDVTEIDLAIGAELLMRTAARTPASELSLLARSLLDASIPIHERVALALAPSTHALAVHHPDRTLATRSDPWPIVVDPAHARFAAWYELFPRSTGHDREHGTFRTTRTWLPYVAKMGFDVLYLPPIHPIGQTARKGPNNTLAAGPDDPGSPWAIGNADGGHTAVHPQLGTLDDFDDLVGAAREHGLAIALDIAFQASPDHPWVREHPGWFRHRPDGTIQYAENPPKKYQDVYPFDFECDDWRALWAALRDVFLFWVDHGVTIFRVDNPHTKPLPFWEWCIDEVKRRHPSVTFLAEAFTRPSLKLALARVGFSQGYTYFTWRSSKAELVEYLTELTRPEIADVFRPSFWPNTPDILPEDLQVGGRPAFIARLVLAATLSSHYGVYGPAFELLENVPRPGSGEYIDSEKYEIKRWDLDREDSLRRAIAVINRIRHEHHALAHNETLRFYPTDNDHLLCYGKTSGDDAVLVAVNLDFHHRQAGWVELDLDALGLRAGDGYQVHDVLGGGRYLWHGRRGYIEIDPQVMPAQVFVVRRRARTERDFDYFL